jgi:hypothetical protein
VLWRLDKQTRWFYDILAMQIKYYKPDVLLNQAVHSISSYFLQEMKSYVRLLIGQIASPLPQGENFGCYDLIISSLPNLVNYFRRMGVPSELNKLAFEPKVLERLEKNNKPIISVSFVGSLFPTHAARIRWLDYLCQRLDIEVWGNGIECLPENSSIHQRYREKAWGIEMYQIMQRSKITLNHHIDISAQYANNMRLFEATGVGAFLITDWKENLHEMFEPGKEVVTYRNAEECVELIKYYLEHDNEREAIAKAGQQRTLREHTYYQRMQELGDIIRKYFV